MIPNLFLFCVWLFYAHLEGIREGHYYHSSVQTGDANKFNIHDIFYVQRACVLGIIGVIPFDWSLMIGCILSFSAIHDGAYYLQRHALDKNVYPEGWKSQSITSTAFFELNYKQRIFLLIVGISIFLWKNITQLAGL